MRGVSPRLSYATCSVHNEYIARFMPIQGPAANGSLHLSFPSHPPPEAQQPLSLFRPSHFPLGVIGVASCTSDPFTTTLDQFDATLSAVTPEGSMFPLSKACFAFEDEDADGGQLADQISGIEVIPSMDTKKTKLHIGTLLASLCSRILVEFASMVRCDRSACQESCSQFTLGPKPGVASWKRILELGPVRNHSLVGNSISYRCPSRSS